MFHLSLFLAIDSIGILFFNCAGTYFLEDDLKMFFERYGKEKKLLTAVQYDHGVLSFLADCRALGMIDKLVTGPIWRVIAKKGTFLI